MSLLLGRWPELGTVIIDKRAIEEIASDTGRPNAGDKIPDRSVLAKRLLGNAAAKLDNWGCQNISTAPGKVLSLISELIESGSVVVIDDATGKPVVNILSRSTARDSLKLTYHLAKATPPFLTHDSRQIEIN